MSARTFTFSVVAPATTRLGQLAAALSPRSWVLLNSAWTPTANSYWRHSQNFADIANYANQGIWDETAQKAFFIGQGHSAPVSSPYAKIVTYNAVADTWTADESSIPAYINGLGHIYDHVAYDSVRRHWYVASYALGGVARYDIAAGTWTQLPSLSTITTYGFCWFPERNSLVAIPGSPNATNIVELVYGASSWTTVAANPHRVNYQLVAEYSNGAVYFGGGQSNPRQWWRLNANGTTEARATASAETVIDVGTSGGVICKDPGSNKLIAKMSSGVMTEYDPATNTWATVSTTIPTFLVNKPWDFCVPIPTHNVILYHASTDGAAQEWLYKHG